MKCPRCDKKRLPQRGYCEDHACASPRCPNVATANGRCAVHKARQVGLASVGAKSGAPGKLGPPVVKSGASGGKSGPPVVKSGASGGKSRPPVVKLAAREPSKGAAVKKHPAGGALDGHVQAIIDAWAPVTNEPPERHGALFADHRFTRFFIHAEHAIALPQVRVSGGHYFIVIRDAQNAGYLVDTLAETPVVQLNNLSGFLSDLAAGRIGGGAYILALRPKEAAAPAPRRAVLVHPDMNYTMRRIGDRDFEFLDFRNNNCGAVSTLGVGCLPPENTHNLTASPYHEIHRFLPALSAHYTIHAAYRAPTPALAGSSQGARPDVDAQLKKDWEQFNAAIKERCDQFSFNDYVTSVRLSRNLAVPAGEFVHRWGCVQLVVYADGTRAPWSDMLAEACEGVVQRSFPIACGDSAGSLDQDLDRLAKRGLRLVAIPQSLFELILLVAPARVNKQSKPMSVTFAQFADQPQVVCHPEEVSLRTFRGRGRPIDLKNRHFIPYANQWVVEFLCRNLKGPLPLAPTIDDWLRIAGDAFAHIREQTKSLHLGEHLVRATDKPFETQILQTLRLEYEACGTGAGEGPGFQLYRVTTEFSEDSSLKTHEISYGASLFGGWMFDGPDNGSKSACVMAYVMAGGSGKNHNYYVLRVRLASWNAQRTSIDFRRRLQTLHLPPVPICLQLFGYKGGFHPRMFKTEAAGINALSDTEALQFMRYFHISCRKPAGKYINLRTFPDAA